MIKGLQEKRNTLIEEMEGLVSKIETETRAFDEDEQKRMAEIKEEIRKIDETIKSVEDIEGMEKREVKVNEEKMEQREIDEQLFLKFIKGEERALDVANNGGIIPTSIANRIIEKVKELSPIYSMATVYNVGGDLVFPVYDESTSSIGATYVDDLQELTESTGKFTTVKLQNFIVGCLAKESKSLINRTDFDLVGFIVNKVAKAIAEFLEKELINGTTNKMTGVLSATQTVTSGTINKVDFDDIIDLMDLVPEVFQSNSCFIMHKSTRKALRKLKDTNGDYILNKDATTPFGYSIFGKPVYITDSMPEFAEGAKAIAYGDMSGLYVKLAQNVELQMLMEKYATQHAIGCVGYVEADSKIVEPQKLAVLTVKASA